MSSRLLCVAVQLSPHQIKPIFTCYFSNIMFRQDTLPAMFGHMQLRTTIISAGTGCHCPWTGTKMTPAHRVQEVIFSVTTNHSNNYRWQTSPGAATTDWFPLLLSSIRMPGEGCTSVFDNWQGATFKWFLDGFKMWLGCQFSFYTQATQRERFHVFLPQENLLCTCLLFSSTTCTWMHAR